MTAPFGRGTRDPFVYQAPDDDATGRIQVVREVLGEAYMTLLEQVPECAERTLAIRKLEEASMWANKAIVFRGERYLT